MSQKWRVEMRERLRSGDVDALASVTHGTVGAYTYGCQCEPCTRAMSDYCKDRRRRLGLTKGTMPSPDQREAAVESYRRRGLKAASEEHGYSGASILSWFKQSDEETLARIEGMVKEDQAQNGRDGIHCPVDGVPMPGSRTKTCSARCAQLWSTTRYQIDEGYKADHKVRIALWNIEHSDDPIALRYSRRIIRGEPLSHHGEWVNSDAQRVMLEEVMERRAQAKVRWGALAADLPSIRAMASVPESQG